VWEKWHPNANTSKIELILETANQWKRNHKLGPEWNSLLENIPSNTAFDIGLGDQGEIEFTPQGDITDEDQSKLNNIAKQLCPWRKGPWKIGSLTIDAEWQSQMKWDRFAQHLPPLSDKKVLDIGCNNGYFMYRLLLGGAQSVIGFDPIPFNLTQFSFLQKISFQEKMQLLLLGVEHTDLFPNSFDLILSMGVLYHHRHPLEQLQKIWKALTPGGQLILETIGIMSNDEVSLTPKDRYAKMRNVWFLPSISATINWLDRCNYKDIEVLSVSKTTTEEQRLTDWCPPPKQSLSHFLTKDQERTIEGYPSPRRFIISAKKK